MFLIRKIYIPIVFLCIVFSFVFCSAKTGSGEASAWLELSPESSRHLAQWAEFERKNENYTDAIRIYKLLLSDDDSQVCNWAALWLGILDSSFEQIDFPKNSQWGTFFRAMQIVDNQPLIALRLLQSLDTDTTQDIVVLFSFYWRGLIFERIGQNDSTFNVLSRIQDKFPQNFLSGEILFRLGRISFDKGDYFASSGYISQSIDFYGESYRKETLWWIDESYYLLAVSELRQDNIDSAVVIAKVLYTIFPDNIYSPRLNNVLSAYNSDSDSLVVEQELPSTFRADLLMKSGWDSMERKKYRKAKLNFLDAYAANPIDDALLFAAECAFRLNEYNTADTLYKKISDSSIVNFAIWGRGWAKIKMGQYSNARLVWRELFSDDVFSDDAAFNSAKSYYLEHNLDSAEIELTEYISGYTRRRNDALFFLYFTRLERGDTARAIETADIFVRTYPGGHRCELVALNAAQAMFLRERYGAVIAWADSFQSYFESPVGDSIVLLAERAKFRIGEYTEPIQILLGFIERRPDSPIGPILAIEMGSQFEGMNQWLDAIFVYTKAQDISLPGDTSWCDATLGILRSSLELGDTTKANTTLEILGIDGEQPWKGLGSIIYAAWLWKHNGDSESAIALYNKVRLPASDSEIADSAVLGLARIYISSQMFPEARQILNQRWDKISHSAPLAMKYAILLARAIWESGEPDSAIIFAANFADSAFAPCSFLLDMGEMALAQGRSILAGKIMDKITLLGCTEMTPTFLIQMGDVMVQLERIPDACNLFALVLQIHPDDSLSEIARKRLDIFSENIETP